MEMVWLLSVMDQPLLPDLVTHNAAEVSKINSFCTFINSVSLIGKHEWDYTVDYLSINIFLYSFHIFVAVDGNWGEWSHWAASYGYDETRVRSCDYPAPSCGGTVCYGQRTQTRTVQRE